MQLGFGCKLKLLQLRVYKTALRLGDVDMTGGDDEEDFDAAAAEEFDDPELAHASMSIQGMKAAPLGM